MPKNEFISLALSKFSGCDNSEAEAGSADSPAIWLLGLEHGTYKSIHADGYNPDEKDPECRYDVELQLRWPYNQKAFKLLAAMHDHYGVKKYKEFANEKQPFVKGSKGFFKGNLYPFPCNKFDEWNAAAVLNTGFENKNEYLNWCKEVRIPTVNGWVNEYQPKLIIGVGIGNRSIFSLAAFGEACSLREHSFHVNGHRKRIFYTANGSRKLAVIPHFSGCHGLNSDESLQIAGEFLAAALEGEVA